MLMATEISERKQRENVARGIFLTWAAASWVEKLGEAKNCNFPTDCKFSTFLLQLGLHVIRHRP